MKQKFKYIVLLNIFYFYKYYLLVNIEKDFPKILLKRRFFLRNSESLDKYLVVNNFYFLNKKDFNIFFKRGFFYKSLAGYRLLLLFSNDLSSFFSFIKEILKMDDDFLKLEKKKNFQIICFKYFEYYFFSEDFFFFIFFFRQNISIYFFLLNYFKQIVVKYLKNFDNN